MKSKKNIMRQKLLLKLLKERREKIGLLQSELAKKLSIPQQMVSKIESGERRLGAIEIIDYCEALGMDAGDLLKQISK